MVTKGTDGPIHDLYVRLLLTRDTAESSGSPSVSLIVT